MKLNKRISLLATVLAIGFSTFGVACMNGDSSSTDSSSTDSSSLTQSSDSSSTDSSSSDSSQEETQEITTRLTVGGTTNVSVPANETVYCAINADSGNYVLEWEVSYAKITIGEDVYTGAGTVDVMNVGEDTPVIAVTTTDGGRATIQITCTLWQPPMLSLGENDDTEVAAGETAIYRFAAPHAGVYTFETESAAVTGFSVTSAKAFENPTPLTAAGALTIEVQAGAEILVEISQNGTSAAIIPVTVTDDTQATEISLDSPTISAPASGRAYYTLPIGEDTYVSWTEENLTLQIAGKTYTGAPSDPILLKYDARSTLYIVATSKNGTAIENATLKLNKALTAVTLTENTNEFIVAKSKTATCQFTAPENGVYTFNYSGSTGINAIDFMSGVNFPIILSLNADATAQTLTATVLKGADLVIEIGAGNTAAASVTLDVTSEALQTETIDGATTLDLTLGNKEVKLYEVTAQDWYKLTYTTSLVEELWQFSCAVNHSPIKDGETGYVTEGDLLIVKTTFAIDSNLSEISAQIELQADDTVLGTTSDVLTLGENHVIIRSETKACTFTATESGTYRISTSDTNAKIIYKLGATNTENEFITGANDELASEVEIELEAGETYTLYIEMLQTTISDDNEETVDPTIHLDTLSFTIEKLA